MILTIISTRRAIRVPDMEKLCAGLNPFWIVADDDDQASYEYAGATDVMVGGGLCESRNLALNVPAQENVLQLSDDLKKVELTTGPTRADVTPITVTQAASLMEAELDHRPGTHLVGVAPTPNPYFSRQRVHTSAFVVGDMILIRAGCPLRFDERFTLKEDYDYTCQHLDTYGEIARIDNLLATFAHRTNRGGAVDVRTPDLEQQNIELLMAKWPGRIKPNPRRENEVTLRWKD